MCSESSKGPQEREESKELREQLIVAEYNQCRSALLKNIELMDRSEVFYLTAAAAATAYFLTNDKIASGKTIPIIELLVGLFPLYILLFGLFRFLALDRTVKIYNDYLQKIEDKHKNSIGLTTFFRKKNQKILFYYRLIPFLTTLTFYCFLLKRKFCSTNIKHIIALLLIVFIFLWAYAMISLFYKLVKQEIPAKKCKDESTCIFVMGQLPDHDSICVFLFGELHPSTDGSITPEPE